MAFRISAGQRDKSIVIEAMSADVSPTGMPIETWSPLATVWASRRDVQAAERFTASQTSAWQRTVWQMPYRADCDPERVDVVRLRRIVFGGRVFDIEAASLLERRLGIECTSMAKAD